MKWKEKKKRKESLPGKNKKDKIDKKHIDAPHFFRLIWET